MSQILYTLVNVSSGYLQVGKATLEPNRQTNVTVEDDSPDDVIINRAAELGQLVIVKTTAVSQQFGTPSDEKGVPVTPSPVKRYSRKTRGAQFLTGRSATLAPFSFESVYANGTIYPAATINSTYPTGISGVLERVADTSMIGSSASEIPSGDQMVWKLRCQPSHVTTMGRPRTQIVGNDLKPYTHYKMMCAIKLHQLAAMGWNDKATPLPLAAIFALSQQGGSAPFDFASGQLAGGYSPLYLTLRGSSLYCEMRTISEELGYATGDNGNTTGYTKWGIGDTVRTSRRRSHVRTLSGDLFHDIEIDFFLDERPIKDGGMGYIKGYFNGQPWFEQHGQTALPRNARGNFVPVMPRLGFYEVSDNTVHPDATAVSTVASCAVERSILIDHYSVMEAL